jgi:hypothetical protein
MHNLTLSRLCGVTGFLLAGLQASAITFSGDQYSGSFDTTISVGGIYRVEKTDLNLVGRANGGTSNSVNSDDGTLNFANNDWVSQAFKVTSDLELNVGDNFSFFARGYYLYDHELADGTRLHKPLTDEAKDHAADRFDYLDLYGVFRFDLGDTPVDFRVGRQVVSWGESTFIPNGNNIVNPIDVSNLRVPGAELREAFLPVNMVKVAADITYNTSIEAFWLLEFRHTDIEAAGTYFSSNDFASIGGDTVYLGFGGLPDTGTLGGIPRAVDDEGNNYSQWGFALRHLAENLGSTEFGLFVANIHSRLPLVNGITPTRPISPLEVQATASALGQQQLVPAMIANGVPAQVIPVVLPQLLGAALTNVPAAAIAQHPTLASFAPFYPAAQQIAAGAQQVGLLSAAATGRYFLEYPEDIFMIGASFNTDLGNTGIAWQGEVSYKQDVPLQIDDVELLFATLSALSPAFGAHNQIGSYFGQYGEIIRGWRPHDVVTAQTTFTKVFGPTLGADSLTLVAEVGALWADIPAPSVLRYEVAGTFTSGSQAAMDAVGGGLPATPESWFADDFAWGYRALARLQYNNVFAGVNILPSVSWGHDVSGNSPAPLSNYLEGRTSLSLSADFVYQNRWTLNLRYVNYSGAGTQNRISDRDFVSTSLKFSF